MKINSLFFTKKNLKPDLKSGDSYFSYQLTLENGLDLTYANTLYFQWMSQ